MNALKQKAEHHGRFIQRGLIGSEDPFVVAINAGEIDDADLDDDLPNIVRAVYPIGAEYLAVAPNSNAPAERGFHPRSAIGATRGRSEPTDTFLSNWYTQISAVLFSPKTLWNTRKPGNEIVVVHNLNARVPLPRGFFPFGREYWPAAGGLHLTDFRSKLATGLEQT